MKYDKNAILNTASNLRSKASGLAEIKNKLSRTSPIKCSPSFYSKRSSLVQRIGNVQNRITNLSNEISKAANKMSSDDVQNARYIREAFQQEASFSPFRYGALPVFDRDLGKGGVYGNTLVISQVTMTNYSPLKLGKATSSKTPWYKKAWNDTKQFFSDASDWVGDRVDDYIEHEKAKAKYLWDSVVVFALGDYSDKSPTALSFVGNIVASIFDVDLPLDIRDLAYDVQHWGEGDHFGLNLALDTLAVLPLIGVVKNLKYADDIADGVKDLGKIADIADTVSDAGKTTDTIIDATDDIKDFGKNVDAAVDAGKAADNASDASKNLGKINPSKSVDPDAKPRGPRTKISENMSDENIRSLTRENEAAETLAKKGYDIEQNPSISGTTRNPDYIIEGKVFDCYSPTADKSVRGIWSTIYEKVITKGQTKRVILNLDDWSGSISELVSQLKSYKIDGLEEVIVVMGEEVTSIYP